MATHTHSDVYKRQTLCFALIAFLEQIERLLLRIETPAELGLENGLLAVGVRDEKVGHDPIIGLRRCV